MTTGPALVNNGRATTSFDYELPGSDLARFLELRGKRVFEAMGVLWAAYRGPFFCSLPYQREIDPDPVELAYVMQRHGVWSVRYPSLRGKGFPGGVYICRPGEYSLEKLSRQYRKQIQHGLEICEIREVEPSELLVHGLPLNLETMQRQKRYDAEFGENAKWRRFVDAVRKSPAIAVTGAYLSGRLSVYVVSCRENGCLHLLYKMSRTLDRTYPVGHALDYFLISQAASDPRIEYIENSFVSIRPNDGLDAYKRRMGYSVLPLEIAIRFHPYLAPPLTNRLTIAVARTAWQFYPKSACLEMAAKLLEAGKTTMQTQTQIRDGESPADVCQHTGSRSYSRLWRPRALRLIRIFFAQIRRAGWKETTCQTLDFIRRGLHPAAKPKTIPKSPMVDEILSLKPGDWVEVKSEQEIRATLDRNGMHRGMAFVPVEMLSHCGGQYRVLKRVEKIFLEESMQNRKLKNTVLLENVHCQGKALDCDRSCYLFWREAWLKKIDSPK